MTERLKKGLILLPILLGVGLFVWLVRHSDQPQQAPITEQARPVRTISVPTTTVVPRALGYGNVEPSKTWEAVAEVSGKIIALNKQLKRGALLGAGQELLRIDPTDFELAAAQIQADIQALQAQLAELAVKETNTRASLAIEKEALTLSEKELARIRQLADKGTVTRSALDQEERNALAQRQTLQSLQNTLNLIPAERRLLEAQLARSQSQLQSAKRDLQRTTITVPFTGRVAEVKIEESEFVRQGDVLAIIDDIAVAEVSAQLPTGRISTLIRSEQILTLTPEVESALSETLGLSARVWLRVDPLQVVWEGRVARFSDTIDTQTRTVGVIVEVDDPYKDLQPGVRPPLLKGMFVEVELRGRPRSDQLVIPRSAVHNDSVYLIDAESRLTLRPVTVKLTQPEFVVIAEGLVAGDQVVISDLVPAIEGMLLQPVLDEEALALLLREATGEDIPQ
ncbi:MAG: efflux RND transporter periplasmic adaptor subunit [Candidatus Competibacteraceae bacterium]|jgi:RND family efflux transporter MFP subunit|nr:efflux RND transporter periplasmic adaptor subunit [Candidatus Competibacteraceae bacterium]